MFPFMQQSFFGAPQQLRRQQQSYSDSLMALNAMSVDRYDMEHGNKILLPQSALQQLINLKQSGPMIFRLTNTVNNRVLYVGVLEFIAEEGTCVVPNWLFDAIGMFEGCQVMIALTQSLPKGKLIKLQPHETAFIDLPDPRAVLENQLRNHVCLTEGETITVSFSGRQYQIDIVMVDPPSQHNAVDINNADVEIDFAPPLDYDETPVMNKQTSTFKAEQQEIDDGSFAAFKGKGQRLDGKPENKERKASGDIPPSQQQAYNPRQHRLHHGVKLHIDQSFQGSSVKVPWTKPPLK